MVYKILLLAGVVFNVTAQSLLKYAMSKSGGSGDISLIGKIVSTVFQPFFLLSILAYAIGFGLYAVSLSKLDLSRAYPVSSIAAIVLISVLSIVFFNEMFSLTKIIGLVVCIVGIILVFI